MRSIQVSSILSTCSCHSKPQAPGRISPASTQVKPPSQTTENFNYTMILEAESEGAALIAEGNNWFCPLRGENVSILRRSGCPPPVGGDKTPWHCGCLICVTALVCAEIDVAFTRPHVGLRGGLFLLIPPSWIHSDLWEPFKSANMRRICINTDIWLCICSSECFSIE